MLLMLTFFPLRSNLTLYSILNIKSIYSEIINHQISNILISIFPPKCVEYISIFPQSVYNYNILLLLNKVVLELDELTISDFHVKIMLSSRQP